MRFTSCYGIQLICFLVFILKNVELKTEFANIFDNTRCAVENKPCQCENAAVHENDVDETIICEQDSLCLEYMMINRTRSTRNLEVRHVSSHSVADDDITVEYSGRPGSYVNNCNNYNFNFTPYQNPDSEANKSYAPWKYVINRHANRIPQDILETECICSKCFSSSRNSFLDHYKVYPIMVTRYFMLKGNGSKIFNAEFSMGCICEHINASQ